MAYDAREEGEQFQTLRQLIEWLGQLPPSDLTTEQKWELHEATSACGRPDAPGSLPDLPALLALAEKSFTEATLLLEHSLPGSDERARLLELAATLGTAILKLKAAIGSKRE